MTSRILPVIINANAIISAQYKQVLAGIRMMASKSGRTVAVFTEKDFFSADTSLWPQVVIASGNSVPFMREVILHMESGMRRVVLAGTDSDQFGSTVSCATHSRRTEMLQVLSYLRQCGRKRVALVGFDAHSINDHHRYLAALSAPDCVITEKDVFRWSEAPETSFDAFFDRVEEYDAAVCPNDVMAVALSAQCARRGIAVPGRLFLASFGGMELSRWAHPGITTTTMDDFAVGEQAVSVWSYIKDHIDEDLVMKIGLPSRIVPRESTCCIPVEGQASAEPLPEQDNFYANPFVSRLVRLDDCLTRRDELDRRILHLLMRGESYEEICGRLYLSVSTLRYRLRKMYEDAGCAARQDFVSLVRGQLGEGELFCEADTPEET